jgi:septum formation protein
MRLYLASTSPARLQTLRAAGIEPIAIAPGVDEEAVVADREAEAGPLAASDMVQLLAQAKAEAIIGRTHDGEPIDGLILGGDSAFLTGGAIHGKPHRPDVARARWLAQNGGHGDLWSGHWLIYHRGGAVRGAVGRADVATVRFAALDDAEIDAYVATGEPLDKAGGYAVQGLGSRLVAAVEGCFTNVVGLPLTTTRTLLARRGLR